MIAQEMNCLTCYVLFLILVKESYTQVSLLSFSCVALHVDAIALADGNYEQIPEPEEGVQEVQVIIVELTEAPDQSSEEPKAEIVSDYREGKPRT